MTEETKEVVIEMSKEFDEKEGCVTCEISIHKDIIDNFTNFVKENTDIKFGKWIIMECNTCVAHNGKGYVHASIETYSVIREMEKVSNFIKTVI